jgi:hypothetical protein
VPRPRDQIVGNLESLYREAYARAQSSGDEAEKARLDFDFRRDQLYLEAVLDVRDLLGALQAPAQAQTAAPSPAEAKGEKSVAEQIGDLRSLARFPFGR